MIRAESNFDKSKVSYLVKDMQLKSLIGSIILSIVLLAMGIVNIHSAVSGYKINVLSLVIGILVCLFSFYPIISTLVAGKNATKNMIKDMNLDKGEITITYEFKDKKIEISTTQNGETKLDTIMMKYLSKVKVSSNSLIMYMQNDDMYLINDSDFKQGTKGELISLFNKHKVQIK